MTFADIPSGRIDPAVMATIPPEIAQWIFVFRADDIRARLRLIDIGESLLKGGNTRGAEICASAEKYLFDRSEYERQYFSELP